MTINWNLLTSWMLGKSKMPLGFCLSYEFRPSIPWHADVREACQYWHSLHSEQHRTDFWHLSREEQEEWGEKLLREKYKTFMYRSPLYCCWQRFTLTSGDGKTIVLQMDSQGSVKQVQKVKRLIEVEEWVEIR